MTVTDIRMHRILVAALGIYTLANSDDECGVCRNHHTITVFDPANVDGIAADPGAHRLRVECPRCRPSHWDTGHGIPVITDLGPGTDVCSTGPLVIVTQPDHDSVLVCAPDADCLGCVGTGGIPLYRDGLETALTGRRCPDLHDAVPAVPGRHSIGSGRGGGRDLSRPLLRPHRTAASGSRRSRTSPPRTATPPCGNSAPTGYAPAVNPSPHRSCGAKATGLPTSTSAPWRYRNAPPPPPNERRSRKRCVPAAPARPAAVVRDYYIPRRYGECFDCHHNPNPSAPEVHREPQTCQGAALPAAPPLPARGPGSPRSSACTATSGSNPATCGSRPASADAVRRPAPTKPGNHPPHISSAPMRWQLVSKRSVTPVAAVTTSPWPAADGHRNRRAGSRRIHRPGPHHDGRRRHGRSSILHARPRLDHAQLTRRDR